LVEADSEQPQLAEYLGVQPRRGWNETTDSGDQLDQAIIEAVANNLAILPFRPSGAERGRTASHAALLSACLKTMQDHYDVVLVDLGALEACDMTPAAWNPNGRRLMDALVLVHNRAMTSHEQLTAFAERFAASGVAVAGIVENFVAEGE
jgi:Mrp family chromosome partitioning ATPase